MKTQIHGRKPGSVIEVEREIWYVVDSKSRVITKAMTKRNAELWAKSPLTIGLYPEGTSIIAIES